MKYKLISEQDPKLNTVQQILVNRGIPAQDTDHYLHTSKRDLHSPFLLQSISDAVNLVDWHLMNGYIFIQVDSDADGFTSASHLYNYLRRVNPNAKIDYRVHPGKEHGVKVEYLDDLTEQPTLVIIPDAGSNQFEEHRIIKEKGISCLVLDHHDAEEISKDALIVNNQLCDYPNKNLSGVGIVHQFCRAYDMMLDYDYAKDYLDLTAIGLIADMMDVRDMETRYIINEGINRIKNPLIQGLIDRQAYALKDGVTPIGIAFYIAPAINATIRVGTIQEKTKLFEAMLEENRERIVTSTKRGFNGMEELLIDQVVRESGNIKNRQNRLRDTGLEKIEELIKEQGLESNQVILVQTNDLLDKTLSGLVANQLMFKYQKPVLLLRETTDGMLEGSARGYDKSELNDLKDFLQCSEMFEYAEGHACAFGAGIKKSKVDAFTKYANKELADMDFSASYLVDFILDANDIKHQMIFDIAGLESFWGKGLDQSEIAIRNLKVTKQNTTLLAKGPTLKIEHNGITYIKFKSSQEEYDNIITDGYTNINIVGRCAINSFNGNVTPQVIISEIEIGQKVDYYF